MKLLIIEGNGTIGKKVSTYFKTKYEVLIAGRSSGYVQLDMADYSVLRVITSKRPKRLSHRGTN